MTAQATPLISIVIPAYNEEGNLPELFRRVLAATDACTGYRFEFILIDNCSEDGTERVCREIVARDARWRYIRFSRNFGVEASLHAGLHFAQGDALIYLFSDLQEPPESIPTILETWRQGNYDVVYGILRRRQDSSRLKSLGARLAYRLIYLLSDVKIPPDATDYRLITRPVIEALKRVGDKNRYMRGLVYWTGFRQGTFTYDRAARKQGRSTANFLWCVGFAINAVVSFTTKPLRLASLVGLGATLLSVLGAIVYTALYVLVETGLVGIEPPPAGWTTITLLILFFGGIQSLFLGILGEYLAHTYNETKQRPLWVIRDAAGFPDAPDSPRAGTCSP